MARSGFLFSLGMLVACGCSGVYPSHGSTPAEAAYDLRADGASFGSARMTSAAVDDLEVQGSSRAVVSVTLIVDNAGDDELRIDASNVTVAFVRTPTEVIDGARLDVISRKASEVGDGAARVEASFALPEGYDASAVVRFALRWSFVRDGEVFEEVTAFYVPSPDAIPLPYGLATPLVSAHVEIYGGHVGPAGGFLPESGVYIAPPPAYVPAQPSMPSWHAPAQPSISHEHAPAQPSTSGGRR